ncbi:MAG: alpha-glucosidase [Saprospiraceae bacterium]|nr:alpha-glucosidase [Saprospiraceae bacterium]
MTKTWWKESVIYQIYPRSFQDSNGDGVGDLQGIIRRLDYLKLLGVDILWLSPIFKSPNDDNGYDVSDYRSIMDEFGTMEDFDDLLAGVHERGMKLILDLVPNHSSDEHFWFQEARKSKDNPYRNYYHWADEPRTNWQSFFSGSTWEYDEQAEAYYLHLFSKKQPDLNWENPKLRQEIHDIMRFWFDKGIDGFRIDVIPFISKRLDWPDGDPNNFEQTILEIYSNGPRLHEYLNEMYEEVCSKYDVMTVGEGIGVKPHNSLEYVDENRRELNMLYHFDHVTINYGPGGKYDPVDWKLSTFKQLFLDWDQAIADKGWINIVLDNHDFPRMVSRYGNDGLYRKESAKLLATMLLTLRGTPCIYQGSEIGMINVAFDSLDEYDDVEVVNMVREWREAGKDPSPLLPAVQQQGRDNARTPMQWDDSVHAGFTSGTPWLKLNPSYQTINVTEALADPTSIFYYYKDLLAFRKVNPTLIYGDFELIAPNSEQLFAYRRWDAQNEFLVFLNFSSETLPIEALADWGSYQLVKSNYLEASIPMRPWECRIYQRQVQ